MNSKGNQVFFFINETSGYHDFGVVTLNELYGIFISFTDFPTVSNEHLYASMEYKYKGSRNLP